jgi:hypothetical protein
MRLEENLLPVAHVSHGFYAGLELYPVRLGELLWTIVDISHVAAHVSIRDSDSMVRHSALGLSNKGRRIKHCE